MNTRVYLLLVGAIGGFLASGAHAGCAVEFDCRHHTATINQRTYPIVCGALTGRGMDGGAIGHLIHANGRPGPGKVPVGTPMITTSPRLCYDCFIHVSGLRFSNGCLGITAAGFSALKACAGSKFAINR